MKCECTIERLKKYGVEWREFDNFGGPEREGWSMIVGSIPDIAFTNISRCPLCGGDIDGKPRSPWHDNSIQFPRLLAELNALGIHQFLKEAEWQSLEASMDLERDKIMELFYRAEKEWERIKNELVEKGQ
jgi:hypothetical protein